MTLVVLLADGGANAGLGHLSRCSSLTLALRRKGALARTIGLGLEAPLERYGISWEAATEPDPAGADAIVIDSYRAPQELRVSLASVAPVVAFCDDDGGSPEATFVVRSGSATGREGDLAGLAYACLGPDFWSTPPRQPKPDVKRILVSTGGGDHTGIGPLLAYGLISALPSTEVVLARGPYAPPTDILDGIRTVSAPDSLLDALIEADIVVSAAGQTMLEALAVGTPCIALITADNQRRQAAELRSIGALTVAESVEEAVRVSCSLAADFDARCRQARAGLHAVDGQGAMRVAAAVLGLARSDRAA